MVTIISVRLKSKSLLRKEIYGDFGKKPENPQKWCQMKMKSVPLESALSKALLRENTVSLLKQQGKLLFCMGSTDLSPVFFFVFFFSRPSGLPELHKDINGSFKSFFAYLSTFYKFRHLQVPNGNENGTFGVVYQVAKLGLLGMQNLKD